MAYDEELAGRVRECLEDEGPTERRMFGGLAFLVGGHMAVAVSGRDGLMVRVDPGESDDLVDGDGVRRMVMRGRELDGWLRVSPDALAGDEDLARWVGVGAAYARSLPPK